MKGLTGENLLTLLERRLDNVLCRLGFSTSVRFSGQLVTHGHVRVNGTLKKAPGYLVKAGDSITLGKKMHDSAMFKKSFERSQAVPPWLELDRANISAKVVSLPTRQDVAIPIDETLIVEFYSR